MTKKTLIALAISAIACTALSQNAMAAKHKHHAATPPPAQAETIPGTNPMTNAPVAPAVEHPAAVDHMPGANPM